MLRIQNISKNFGAYSAVKSCSFNVEKYSITGLIGPNGAGKTTIFNIIAGALFPSGGNVSFNEEDITNLPPHRRFERGLLRTFQIPHEFSKLTVLENLMMVPHNQPGEGIVSPFLSPRRVASAEAEIRKRALDTLDFLSLSPVKDELAGQISGGQKKLLEIGRTMMVDAKLVLLDEPAAGVNPALMDKICDLILTLQKERGYTFCIIEHDMNVISALCDPVVVMAEGTVLMQGDMHAVRSDPQVLEAYLGG